jgi:hypothetical protein
MLNKSGEVQIRHEKYSKNSEKSKKIPRDTLGHEQSK